MSYRQAWLLVDELNRMFRLPLVSAQIGGGGGGGAALTRTGAKVIRIYRQIERHSRNASSSEVRALSALLAALP
jgi:molybdate transport system regulatory protein